MLLDLAFAANFRQGLKDWNDHQARDYGNQQHSDTFMGLIHQLHSFPNLLYNSATVSKAISHRIKLIILQISIKT
jgi:hypothetical protein